GGIGPFPPRPLPTGDEWIGRGLAFFVPSLRDHAGQDVVVVGGGDSACDWALSLEPIALSVTLVHRRAACGPSKSRRQSERQAPGRPAVGAALGSPPTSGRSATGACTSSATASSRWTRPWRPTSPACSRPETSPITGARCA